MNAKDQFIQGDEPMLSDWRSNSSSANSSFEFTYVFILFCVCKLRTKKVLILNFGDSPTEKNVYLHNHWHDKYCQRGSFGDLYVSV